LQRGAVEVKAHLRNTSRRAVVARTAAAAAAAALAGGLASCGGGGSPSAQTLLDDTFASRTPAASGHLALSLAASARSGGSRPDEAFALRLTGPFESLGPARLPRFALKLNVTSAGRAPGARTLRAGATSTGGRLFVELAGRQFIAPARTVAALQRGYAEAGAGKAGSGAGSPFGALGLDPRAWLTHPRIAGSARIAGAEATHIVAELNAARFLADAQRLSAAGAGLGLGSRAPGSPLLSPALVSALSSSLRSARVDVYTGASDHLLRRLSLRTAILPAATGAATGGPGRGTFRLLLTLTRLNKPQAISAPSGAQPLARALPELQRLGLGR
jgi:hypothetical protein